MFDSIFLSNEYDMNHPILEPGSPLAGDQKSIMLFFSKFGWSFVLFHEWDSSFILRMVMALHQLWDKWASGLLSLFTLLLWRKSVQGGRGVVEIFTPLLASMVHPPTTLKRLSSIAEFVSNNFWTKSTSSYKMERTLKLEIVTHLIRSCFVLSSCHIYKPEVSNIVNGARYIWFYPVNFKSIYKCFIRHWIWLIFNYIRVKILWYLIEKPGFEKIFKIEN